MANDSYNRGKARLADYAWSTDAEDLGILLVTSSYTFDPDDNTIADLVTFEVSGPGYGRRAVTASARTVTEDDSSDAAILTISDGTITWTALNVGTNIRVVLFYISGVDINDNANELLGYIDAGVNIPIDTTGSNFALDFGPNGTIRFLS